MDAYVCYNKTMNNLNLLARELRKIKQHKNENRLGYKVIRFWHNDIDENIEGVYQKLKRHFEIDEE